MLRIGDHDGARHRVDGWSFCKLSKHARSGDPGADRPFAFEEKDLGHLRSIQQHIDQEQIEICALIWKKRAHPLQMSSWHSLPQYTSDGEHAGHFWLSMYIHA